MNKAILLKLISELDAAADAMTAAAESQPATAESMIDHIALRSEGLGYRRAALLAYKYLNEAEQIE